MKRIPTNIITGFLGAGKTTSILSLLARKPENEKWAVLINEFGNVGVDGAILDQQGAIVKEVPGGCMCCVTGLPMSVGINALLAQKPDRLLLEPTGLGHPKEVINKLTSDIYQNYIDLKATITVVDPRHFAHRRKQGVDHLALRVPDMRVRHGDRHTHADLRRRVGHGAHDRLRRRECRLKRRKPNARGDRQDHCV